MDALARSLPKSAASSVRKVTALAAGPPSPRRAVPPGCNTSPECDPNHGTDFAATLCCNLLQLGGCRAAHVRKIGRKKLEKRAPMYSILVLYCTPSLSRAECQGKTALVVVRGPTVDNPMMCALNAQTMIARTDLVQGDGSEYIKVVCTRSKNAEEWVAEIEARKAALQPD